MLDVSTYPYEYTHNNGKTYTIQTRIQKNGCYADLYDGHKKLVETDCYEQVLFAVRAAIYQLKILV
mgnify:CR=1 FL=1